MVSSFTLLWKSLLIIPSQCFSNFARTTQLLKPRLLTTLTTWNKTDISQIFVQFVQFSPDEKTISITIKNILITSWFLCFCNMSHLISLIMNSFLLTILRFQQHLPAASPQIILTTPWIFVLGYFSSSPAHLDFRR